MMILPEAAYLSRVFSELVLFQSPGVHAGRDAIHVVRSLHRVDRSEALE